MLKMLRGLTFVNGLEFLPLVVIVLFFWLFFIRPATRRQRETQQMQAALAIGERVILTSGIYGTIRALHDDRLEVEIAEGTTITVDRRAVGAVDRSEAAGEADRSGVEWTGSTDAEES